MAGKVAAFPRIQSAPTGLSNVLDLARHACDENPFPSFKCRRQWLLTLKTLLLENQQAIKDAIDDDFGGRSQIETTLGELMPAVRMIDHHLKYLRLWLEPNKRHAGLLLWPATARVEYHPLGVVGVIAPWNYPLYLAIGPVTAALAAGNRVLVKMSEHTPHLSGLLARLVGQYFSPSVLQVVQGDAKVGAAFARLPFDHLIFTGSSAVGKLVMRSAAENLTPVTLELGGKSPVLIAPDMALEKVVDRLLFGKCFNAGQTCVAPDYVLVPRGKGQRLIELLLAAFERRYRNWQHNADFSAIINNPHYQRLCQYLEEAKAANCELHHPAIAKLDTLQRLGLHLLLNPPSSLALMKEEIFGPILPVIEYDSLNHAIAFIKARPKPLAFYPFSMKVSVQQQLLQAIHAGGVCINDVLLQVTADELPFGGIGHSGFGHYHGKEGVRALSHVRAVLKKGRWNPAAFFYPPYKRPIIKWLLKGLVR
ncbi:coniferyl aldehyde dehydrogenase [Gallaecimonas mangrovi]|uniref:coniferyl aldehyde dehydrogenase n=1 Tax=Gallaecimonas mangrovi TaxID=2291597 RepID=UPI000E1FBC07|nr:coniferyl aldehyde dehydrogenase [Gallaecimonas mangrovi]